MQLFHKNLDVWAYGICSRGMKEAGLEMLRACVSGAKATAVAEELGKNAAIGARKGNTRIFGCSCSAQPDHKVISIYIVGSQDKIAKGTR